jgi:hypothetical protein
MTKTRKTAPPVQLRAITLKEAASLAGISYRQAFRRRDLFAVVVIRTGKTQRIRYLDHQTTEAIRNAPPQARTVPDPIQ